MQVDKRWVVTRFERVCGKSKVSAGSEDRRRNGNDLVCKKNTYEAQGAREDVPADGRWEPVMETRHEAGSRPRTTVTFDFDVRATWTASYKGKTRTGTLAFEHHQQLVRAPELGTHEILSAFVPTTFALVTETFKPEPGELAAEVAQLFSAESEQARETTASAATGIDAEDAAACKIVLLDGQPPADFAKRYGVDHFAVRHALRFEIRKGEPVFER